MLAILAENISDAEVLTHLVRRRSNDYGLRVKKRGYGGCAVLCKKGARDISAWVSLGVTRIIVCHDADCNSPDTITERVVKQIIRPSGFEGPACVAVPVEEIEAWMIADEVAINQVIPSFKLKGHSNPESIQYPKEWLCAQSRVANGKPLYSPKTFNPAVARRLRFEVVARKCPSFKNFLQWVDRHCIPD
jgi:hypothetical protein